MNYVQSKRGPSLADLLANIPQKLPEIIITGPINSVMRNEGRSYALDVARSAGAEIRDPKVVEKIIGGLTVTASVQPSSYAQGIVDVINVLRGES